MFVSMCGEREREKEKEKERERENLGSFRTGSPGKSLFSFVDKTFYRYRYGYRYNFL